MIEKEAPLTPSHISALARVTNDSLGVFEIKDRYDKDERTASLHLGINTISIIDDKGRGITVHNNGIMAFRSRYGGCIGNTDTLCCVKVPEGGRPLFSRLYSNILSHFDHSIVDLLEFASSIFGGALMLRYTPEEIGKMTDEEKAAAQRIPDNAKKAIQDMLKWIREVNPGIEKKEMLRRIIDEEIVKSERDVLRLVRKGG